MKRRWARTRHPRRIAGVLGLAVGLILLGLPVAQADACGSNHTSPPLSGQSGSDCDCCGGTAGALSGVNAPCNACVAAVGPMRFDLPELSTVAHRVITSTLPMPSHPYSLDHPPTR